MSNNAPANLRDDLQQWLTKLRHARCLNMQSFYDGLTLGKIGTLMVCGAITFSEYQNLHALRLNAILHNNKELLK